MLGGRAAGGRERAFIDLGAGYGVGVVGGSLGETAGANGNATRVGGTPPPRNETGWGGTSSGGPLGESFNAIFHSGVPTTPPTLNHSNHDDPRHDRAIQGGFQNMFNPSIRLRKKQCASHAAPHVG